MYFYKIARDAGIIITKANGFQMHPAKADDYRKLIKLLDSKHLEYHTFTL